MNRVSFDRESLNSTRSKRAVFTIFRYNITMITNYTYGNEKQFPLNPFVPKAPFLYPLKSDRMG